MFVFRRLRMVTNQDAVFARTPREPDGETEEMTLLTKIRVATEIDQPTVAAEGNLELDNREDLKTDAVAEASWVQVTKFGGYRGDDDSMHHLQRCDAKFRLLTEGGWWFITNRQITFGNGTNLKTDPFCSRLKSFGSRHFLPLLTFTVCSVSSL